MDCCGVNKAHSLASDAIGSGRPVCSCSDLRGTHRSVGHMHADTSAHYLAIHTVWLGHRVASATRRLTACGRPARHGRVRDHLWLPPPPTPLTPLDWPAPLAEYAIVYSPGVGGWSGHPLGAHLDPPI